MRQEPFFTRKYHVLALLVGAILALTLLLGTAFVLVELHHHCTGEDCPICAAVARDTAFLKADSAAVLPRVSLASRLLALPLAFAMPRLERRTAPSLVSLKVKLSD